MSKSGPVWIDRCRRGPLLLCGLLGWGCIDVDGSVLLRPAGGAGGGANGGTGGAGSGGAGAGGGGGSMVRDAGTDAAPDASGPGYSCRVGSLEDYCALLDCPVSLAAARTQLAEPIHALSPIIIVQRACTAPSGAARISVSADYVSLSQTYIYDAQGGQLVGVERADGRACYGPHDPSETGFGDYPGFYGEEAPDCGSGFESFIVPAACGVPQDYRSLDAGALRAALVDAGVDAGPEGGTYACVVAP